MSASTLSGVLNLNKPTGKTSRDVVDRVQRLVRPAKAGHAGTLDPLATGVLVVCVGPATRLIDYLQRAEKRYRATFLLGRSSPTDDIEGDVTMLDAPPIPSRGDLEAALRPLIGRIEQRPPVFSALKLQGQRAYKLARQGKPVELVPRPVDVYAFELVAYDYPQLEVDIRCGGGTYVRALGRDLAHSLGTAAVMSALVRTAIGSFAIDDACAADALTADSLAQHLQDPRRAVESLPRMTLTADEMGEIRRGRWIAPRERPAGDEIAALDADGRLVAILVPRRDGRIGPKINLVV